MPRPSLDLKGEIKAQALVKSVRYDDLDRRQQYFDCTQHDWKKYDFDSRPVRAGATSYQPLITSEVAPFYVPLRQRRPSFPVRIGKVIVDAFTNMLFGEERWPRFLCPGDADTQDYADALMKEEDFRIRMVEARNLGGAIGSVALTWCFLEGKPYVEVHNTKNLYVHEWENRQNLIPGHMSEIYTYPVDEYDQGKGKVVRSLYWYRHDWTPDEEICFLPVKFKRDAEPEWFVDEANSVQHDFGFVPGVWIQNSPAPEPEGIPDFHGQYEAMDTLDLIASVLGRGTILNLDPTLVLNMDVNVAKKGVKKGSDNALVVGEGGDAKYLELAGTSVEAGIKLYELKRKTILEACQCVVPDPNEVAASGTSSVAIKAIYQPMLGKGAMQREMYGAGMRRLIEQQLKVAREQSGQMVPVTVPGEVGEDGTVGDETTEEMMQVIDLPPKIEEVPVEPEVDPDTGLPGQETGETTVKTTPRIPGTGERIDLGWGEWFPLTPEDKNQAVQALQLAAGSKAVLSQQSAVEEAAVIFNRNPNEEWGRLKKTQDADQAREEKMMQDHADAAGGFMPPEMDPLKGGVKPPKAKPPGGGGNPFG